MQIQVIMICIAISFIIKVLNIDFSFELFTMKYISVFRIVASQNASIRKTFIKDIVWQREYFQLIKTVFSLLKT